MAWHEKTIVWILWMYAKGNGHSWLSSINKAHEYETVIRRCDLSDCLFRWRDFTFSTTLNTFSVPKNVHPLEYGSE